MEPDLHPEVQDPSKFENLNKVTPFSKYLAMSLFVILPFIGGWIGYQFAPEKVVEVEKIIEIEPKKNEVKVEEKIEYPSAQSFNTTYRGSRFGEIGVSSDDTKKYVIQLPKNESVCCEYMHYIQMTNPNNGFTTIEEFFSLEEAGLLYQFKWPVSTDNKYIAVSSFNDKALLLCDQGMGLENKRVNNVLNIIDMDTAEVKTIFTHEYEAANFQIVGFSSDNSEVILKQTMYPINDGNKCANNLLPGDTKTVSYPIVI